MSEKKETFTNYPCEYTVKELHCTYGENDIFGTLYAPNNGKAKHPAVILSHGYNGIGDYMQDLAALLAENGVLSYIFDFCGGSTRSKSSGKTVDMSIKTEQENLRHIIDMISSLDNADKDKIYLYGESQGGYVSALTGAEMPDRIAGMFLIFPAFCIVDQWLAMNPETMTEPFEFLGDMRLSKKYYDDVPRYDVYEHIKKFTNHVVIYHGDKDDLVDVSYSEKINKAFPDSELIIVKGAGHGFGEKDRKMMINGVCKFFSENKLN